MDSIAQLADFVTSAEQLWRRYLELGPGQLKPEEHRPVADLFASLELPEFPEHVAEDMRLIHELTRRCAVRPEGLSFITGEAGLIARKDQHQALEQALRTLREHTATKED